MKSFNNPSWRNITFLNDYLLESMHFHVFYGITLFSQWFLVLEVFFFNELWQISYWPQICLSLGLPRWYSDKESTCQCRRCKRCGFDPWDGKIPLEKAMTTCSSILAWKIPCTEEPGRLHFLGSQSQIRLTRHMLVFVILFQMDFNLIHLLMYMILSLFLKAGWHKERKRILMYPDHLFVSSC